LALVPLPPVVFTYSFTVGAVVPSIVNEVGETEQVEPTGPEQVNAIESLKPLTGVTEKT
jgi:hypothetical protein